MKTKLKLILLFPVLWIWVLCYKLSSQKSKIDMDLDRFCKVHNGFVPQRRRWYYLLIKLVSYAEFRSLFLFRLGKIQHIIRYFMPKGEVKLAFDIPRDNLGGGLFIQHGYCTDLSARSIGENCWINQKVCLGYQGNDCPTIGNNVRIGVGAVVIGGVKIGNNVNIGANAIVVHDVPDNCTICSPYATVVKQNNS